MAVESITSSHNGSRLGAKRLEDEQRLSFVSWIGLLGCLARGKIDIRHKAGHGTNVICRAALVAGKRLAPGNLQKGVVVLISVGTSRSRAARKRTQSDLQPSLPRHAGSSAIWVPVNDCQQQEIEPEALWVIAMLFNEQISFLLTPSGPSHVVGTNFL